jgi:hypothetical protein
MLTLTAVNVLDASQPINVDYTHGAVFAVLALVLAEGDPRRGLGWRKAAALACAVLSGFGDAAGLAVWPAMAWGALQRRDWRWLAAVVSVGAAFIGFYASSQGAETGSSFGPALQDPANAARLALNVLALPWGVAVPAHAWILGLLVALLAVAALVAKGGPHAPRSERIASGLILFAVGTAAMAGLGRAGLESPLETPLRYAVFLAPLHTGFLMLALPFAAERWRGRVVLSAGLAALLLALLAQDLVLAAKVVAGSDRIRSVIADFQAGRRTPEMRTMVHPDLARAEQDYAGLRRDGLFQHELHLKRAPSPR